MRSVLSDVFKAFKIGVNRGALSFARNGVPPPKYVTGWRYLLTDYYTDQSGGLALAAGVIHYARTYIWEARTFQGISIYNSGTGDNGDTVRVALYTDSAAGPTTLVKDFGEITLTGAAAERVVSSSFTITQPGWYWIAVHTNQAASYYIMKLCGNYISNVGYGPNQSMFAFSGCVGASAHSGSGVHGYYVTSAYGAAASTAVAPTNDLGGGGTNFMPSVALIP